MTALEDHSIKIPSISVITPTYNRGHLLPNMIISVQAQTYQNWELIIVDDGSTDNTAEVIKPYLEDKRIKYIQKSNSGAAHSRNVGVEHSKAEYIIFLDSDDEAYENWLEEMVGAFDNLSIGVVCCACRQVDDEGNYLKDSYPTKGLKAFGDIEYKVLCGVFAVRKSAFQTVGGYTSELSSNQHSELFFRLVPYLLEHGLTIIAVKKILIQIFKHNGSRIRNNWDAVYKGTLYVIDHHNVLLRSDKRVLSNYYGVLANASYRLGMKRTDIFSSQLKAIVANPTRIKGYVLLLKYLLGHKVNQL